MSTTPASDVLLTCAGCGASIYPEHLDRHVAGYWAGALYCSYCLPAKKGGGNPPPPIPDELTTFPLEEALPTPTPAPAPAATTAAAPAAPASPPAPAAEPAGVPVTRRPPRPGAKGVSRVRIFHARLSDGAVGHLDQQINDWLDQNPDIEIKLANTNVGTWEGKHAEPNLILTLFY